MAVSPRTFHLGTFEFDFFFVFDSVLTTLSKKLLLFTTIRVYLSKTGKKLRPESPRRGPVLLGRARVPMLASPFRAYRRTHGRSRTRGWLPMKGCDKRHLCFVLLFRTLTVVTYTYTLGG
jgi:hypothetical protein